MDPFKHRSEVNRRSMMDHPGISTIRLSTGRGVVRRLRWTGFAGAVVAIVLAMPTMSAVASTVVTRSGEIHYEALDGETNVLSISRDATYFYFREGTPGDPGVTISPDPDCEYVPPPAPADDHLARCPAVDASGNRVLRVTVSLGDQNDRLRVTDSATPSQPPFPVEAFGEAGDDSLTGGAGNDDLQGGVGVDRLGGGGGNDQLDFPDSMSQGADFLDGGPGDDKMNGGPAGAPLEPDVLSGGEGTDTADFSRRTEGVTIKLDGEANDGESGEHDNVQPGVECVIGGSSNDTLIGSSAGECLDGRDGEDTIEGRAGDDMLWGGVNDPGGDNLDGGSGSDEMRGGPGDDALAGGAGDDYELGEGGGDTVEGQDGNDRLQGGAGADAVDGGEGNDSVDGAAFLLIGGDGPDQLTGGPGDDTLLGNRGRDRLDGGTGSDFMSGGSERDTVTYEERTNRVFVTLDSRPNDGEAGERDNVLADVERVLGGIRGDDLSGDADADTVAGGRGEDLINGRPGLDELVGGGAPDVVRADDRDPDDVNCGDAEDLAIADRRDRVIDCETVDRPGARDPIVGRYARVVRDGEFRLRLPQGRRFFPLDRNVKIPIGSTVDPKTDVVGLVTARNRTGARQVASVSAGRFAVHQEGRRRPVTELRLAGRLPDCRGSSPGGGRAKRAARASARTLRVDVGGPASAPRVSKHARLSRRHRGRRRGGRFRVLGRNSVGASHGTEWLTEDRCDGTLTKVISGTVLVRDFGRRQTVTVRPGKPYLAAAR
jgi:Ca2+-binding RTX toxin-like protein